MNTLSDRLKQARRLAKMTQQEVAAVADINQSSYQELESGKALRSAYIAEIAAAMNVSTQWLITGKGLSTNVNIKDAAKLKVAERFLAALPELDQAKIELIDSLIAQLDNDSQK